MRINKRLNLVVTVPRDAGGTMYAHAEPISREAFEASFELVAASYARLFRRGALDAFVTAPAIAHLTIRKVAAEMKAEDEAANLLAEMRRLTNLVAPSGAGWSTTPLHVAINQKLISDDELAEVENAVAFFILASAMTRRHETENVLSGMNDLWETRTVSSDCTAFASSLKTSTADASSGATAEASSRPS